MKANRLITSALLALLLCSCSNDRENDLIDEPDVIENPNNPNDNKITYSDDIAPIMQSSCVSCHASPPVNGAPFSLINFSQVNQRANGVLNRMSLQSGSPGAMPPSGRLPQATIDLIQQWITDGKLQN